MHNNDRCNLGKFVLLTVRLPGAIHSVRYKWLWSVSFTVHFLEE